MDDDIVAFFDFGEDEVLREDISRETEGAGKVPGLVALARFDIAVEVEHGVFMLPVLRI